MIQVRCPECGYLQTLSEERFLTISEDFLNCPHCHTRVPKQWAPADSDSVPEEARHKILAFSRRILNGGDVGREVVYALESLVRHHGALEFSNKALGMGYACLGDAKKAEEFLVLAHKEAPDDLEIQRCLTKVLLDRKKFTEALEAGRSVMDSAGTGVWDQDVARTAHALIGLGKVDEARSLLDSHPNLDPRNPAVKLTRKLLPRVSRSGLGSRFGARLSLHKLFGNVTKESVTGFTRKARDLVRRNAALNASRENSVSEGEQCGAKRTSAKKNERLASQRGTLECWIYTESSQIPRWDQIRESLAERCGDQADRERAFKILESLIEQNNLTIDYIVKDEARDLFYYPEDLIPENSRGVTNEDREILVKAQMIVRMRLSHAECSVLDGLIFMTQFVEAVRVLIGGLVQDAVSHVLWGTQEWGNHVRNPQRNFLESEVNIQVLDEGGGVWVHSHGMQKFGLPDLELEGIPSDLASSARKFMLVVAGALPEIPDNDLKGATPLSLPGASYMFKLEPREPDEEGHFSGGSFKIIPLLRGQEPSVGAVDVIRDFQSNFGRSPASDVPINDQGVPEEQTCLKEQFLSAHNRARHNLPAFKKSFRNCREIDKHVHAVKVGFPTKQGQYEWMWVKLETWRGRTMEGTLQNSPVLLKDMQKGSHVRLSDTDIFDWAIVAPDSILDGAFTEKIATS